MKISNFCYLPADFFNATADILRNFYSNASCFSLVWLYLGNSQVSVDRTIGPTLVYLNNRKRIKQNYLDLYKCTHEPLMS